MPQVTVRWRWASSWKGQLLERRVAGIAEYADASRLADPEVPLAEAA